MTQADVYKIMQKNKNKWLCTTEIAKKIGISSGSTNANLNKLLQQGLVSAKINKLKPMQRLWKYLK